MIIFVYNNHNKLKYSHLYKLIYNISFIFHFKLMLLNCMLHDKKKTVYYTLSMAYFKKLF